MKGLGFLGTGLRVLGLGSLGTRVLGIVLGSGWFRVKYLEFQRPDFVEIKDIRGNSLAL